MQRVTAQDLQENVGNILNISVIATQVQLKVRLHRGIEFRNEDDKLLSLDKTVMTRDIGNVTRDTEVTFEYRLKKVKELLEMEGLDLETLKTLPLQAQIFYSAMDGSRCVRVLTLNNDISADREKLEENANYEVMGLHAIKKTS